MSEKTYRIGEVAQLLQLKSYVLRFWETEFAQLEPLRTDKGQRLYTERHIDVLRRIKDLLHVQGMTIEGARRTLHMEKNRKWQKNTEQKTRNHEYHAVLQDVYKELLEVRHFLAGTKP